MKKIISLLLCTVFLFGFFITANAATVIPFTEPQVYTLDGEGDSIKLSFTTTANDSFYRLTIKNLSVNDNICMTVTDKYGEELAKFDYWSYLGKGGEKYVDLKLNQGEKYNFTIWANGQKENGNIKVSVTEIIDDVKDFKDLGKVVALNQSNMQIIDANNDVDCFKVNTTNHDSFYRVYIKNLSINDNICMSVTDKYEEEVAKFDYWSYLGKGGEKYVDLKLNHLETYYVSVWVNGKIETGNYEIIVKELIDDVADDKNSGESVASDTAYVRTVTANNDVDFYRWTADKTKLKVTITNHSINDNLCMIIYDKYDAELAKFDYWSYIGKGGEKSVEIETAVGETYYVAVWANGKVEIGDYKVCFGNENRVIDKPVLPKQDGIKVLVNGVLVVFDQQPIIENDRTLVPLRAIFEALGAEVGWDGATATVTAYKNGTQISLQIGSTQMYVNGVVKVLDVPAKLLNDRTLVPVRAVSEAFGCSVDWDGSTQTVIIVQ